MKTIAVTSATAATATQTLTGVATAPSNNDTVTIGTKVYTCKTTLTGAADEILIGASLAAFLDNLKSAINATAGAGTTYGTGTVAHTLVTATDNTNTTQVVASIEAGLDGNAIATTETFTPSDLVWGAATLSGGQALTIVGTVSDETFTQPSQRVTVGEFPTGNPAWSRAHRLTNDAHFVERNLSSGVVRIAWPLDEFAKVAAALEPTTSWPPLIGTEPTADATAFATALLTSNGTAPSNNDEVAIGTRTYTFKTTLSNPDDVLIEATAAASLDNLKSAVNATAGEGTTYGTGTTIHADVSATTNTDTTQLFVAKAVGTAANAYTFTTTGGPRLVCGAATFSGGVVAATFTVVATSETATLTYQWQYSADGSTGWTAATGTVNGCVYTNDTTATLTCTPTTTGQTGYYHRCAVTNAAGTTNSDAVVLTIT